jgi:xanthosine phosphorylase
LSKIPIDYILITSIDLSILFIMTHHPKDIAQWILKQYPEPFQPKVGIVLGSGLGQFGDTLERAVSIPYSDIPGFPSTTVIGHSGELILGYAKGTPVVCLKGRAHLYEGIDVSYIKTYVRTLKCLGCEYFIATNASGSLRQEMEPGSIMMINDHINFMPINPLTGPNDEEFGPRFLPVDQAYHPAVQKLLKDAAQKAHVPLHEGVYISVQGPQYETAAEIRAFQILGADAVGMSTVPEVLVAHHCGMKVGALATLTNYATGLAKTSHDHHDVVAVANRASKNLIQIVHHFLENIQ